MMPGNPWHLQGIEPAAKANAEESARRVGLSVEQWLNDLIHRSGASDQAPPYPTPQYAPHPASGYHPAFAQMPPPMASPPGWDHDQNGINIHSLNSSIGSLASQIENLVRQNTATSIPVPPQTAPPPPAQTDESRAEVDRTLRSIVDLIETSNNQTNNAINALESRVNAGQPVASSDEIPPAPMASPAPQSAPAPALDKQPTRFMARKERRRRRLAGIVDEPKHEAAPAPVAQPVEAPQLPVEASQSPVETLQSPVETPQSPVEAPPAYNPDMESLLALAQSLQDSLSKQQTDTGVTDIRDDIRGLADKISDAGQPPANDETLARLQGQVDRIARQFDTTAEGLANLGDLDRKVENLFDRLEQTRQTIQESSQITARDAAEQVARTATRAAVDAATEQVARQLPTSVAGNEAAIVKGLDGKIQDLRADICLTDERSLHMFDQVQVSLKAIQKQLDERPGEPAPDPARTASPDQPAKDPGDGHLKPAQMIDHPPVGAPETVEPAAGPMTAPPVVIPPKTNPQSTGEPVLPTDTTASRPRAPGTGRPGLKSSAGPVGDKNSARQDRPTPKGTTPAPKPGITGPVANPQSAPRSLKTASTNDELLAAARRAARAAANATPKSDSDPKRIGLRGRIAERTSNFRRQRAAARDDARAAKAKAGENAQAETGGSAARKPLVLAAAAILLFVGSVQVYDMVNKRRNQVPTGPQAISSSSENLAIQGQATPGAAISAGNPSDQVDDQGIQPDSDGDAPAAVRIIPPASRESALPSDDITGSLPATSVATAAVFGSAATSPVEPQNLAGDRTQGMTPDLPGDEIRAPFSDAPVQISMANIPATGSAPAALRTAAANGDPAAQFEIASRLAEGRGTAPDPTAALAWYQMAAAQGLAPAQYRLGSMYEKGMGAVVDRETARIWYQRAAEQGNRKAMHNLAVIYADGLSGGPDFESAAQWFRKAADYGLNDSQFNLGILYARGMGVPRNMAEAYKWLEIASANGDADAGARRDTIAAELDEQSLVAARLATQTWQPTPLVQSANAVALPAGGWGPDGSEATATALPGPDIIRNVQILLKGLGHDPGPIDGLWGPNTRRAITEFQSQNQLTASGQLTPDLLRNLQQASG